ncbi:radical SAM protein [Actinomadura sp. 6K520]|uniref:radical SAM protein n=1 Tax=Actinomadura sp. 6K520 TaxID=2530364 RepID=UPI0010450362|nr:radical SAM protein [Actinomadura sp. 6K520]TDE25239.1 radical SAM protein [Actinomadura sp. 6K520]
MTIEDVRPSVRSSGIRMLWLDLTRTCQLACMHCYNDSGVRGTHGTMTCEDWIQVIDEADAIGVRRLQLIGGEPTMHPHAADLTEHALALGMSVEVYTNLVHVPGTWWALFQRHGVSIATSYYSDDPAEHNSITGRPSHARTRANIQSCIQLGVPLFVGIVDTGDSRRADRARRELAGLGVTRLRIDHVRPFGRAAGGRPLELSGLCGRCGSGKAAVGPMGDVSPCPMSAALSVGNVHATGLAAILGGAAMTEAAEAIRAAVPAITDCDPDGMCSPGHPGSGCSPRT